MPHLSFTHRIGYWVFSLFLFFSFSNSSALANRAQIVLDILRLVRQNPMILEPARGWPRVISDINRITYLRAGDFYADGRSFGSWMGPGHKSFSPYTFTDETGVFTFLGRMRTSEIDQFAQRLAHYELTYRDARTFRQKEALRDVLPDLHGQPTAELRFGEPIGAGWTRRYFDRGIHQNSHIQFQGRRTTLKAMASRGDISPYMLRLMNMRRSLFSQWRTLQEYPIWKEYRRTSSSPAYKWTGSEESGRNVIFYRDGKMRLGFSWEWLRRLPAAELVPAFRRALGMTRFYLGKPKFTAELVDVQAAGQRKGFAGNAYEVRGLYANDLDSWVFYEVLLNETSRLMLF